MKYVKLVLLVLPLSCGHPIPDGDVTDPSQGTFERIMKAALETDGLQDYFVLLPDGNPYPVYVVYLDSLEWYDREPKVTKFGQPVRFVHQLEADSSGLTSYYQIGDYVVIYDTARVQLYDPTRALLFNFSLAKSRGKWQTIDFVVMPDN